MSLSRREFLRRSGALVASLSASAIVGCETKTRSGTTGPDNKGVEWEGDNKPAILNPGDPPKKPDSPVLQKKGTIIGTATKRDAGGAATFVLSTVDLDAAVLAARQTELTFNGHGYAPNPLKPERIVVFEKQGAGCCEVDLKAGKVLATITTPKSRKFYGHGAYSRDGKLLYATETIVGDQSYKGVIVVRDGTDFKELGTFPTFGEAPHDCHLIDDGKVLVITNGGAGIGVSGDIAAPSVTYVDVQGEKLIERVTFPNEKINAGHLAVTSRKDLAVVSAPRDGLPQQATQPGAISLRPRGGEISTMSEPAETTRKMIGETLSVAINEQTGVVGATNPFGNIVTFWNLAEKRLVKTLDLRLPRGICMTLDRKDFVITFLPLGGEPSLQRFNGETLEPIAGSLFGQSFMAGSHIMAYDL